MDLPRIILLKSIRNNKYLRYRKDQDSDHASLQFSQDQEEENAEIQYVQFEVQKSEMAQGFVHIRSCYNNKYWVRKSAESKSVVAAANEPEEDQTKWSCTLFKLEDVEGSGDADVGEDADAVVPVPSKPQKVRLVHSDQMGQRACVVRSSSVDLVIAGGDDEDSARSDADAEDVFLAYDVSMRFRFPDRIAFIGQNKKYGAVTTVGGVNYLEFKATDMGERGVVHSSYVFTGTMIRVDNRSFTHGNQSVWWNRQHIIAIGSTSTVIPVYFTPLRLGGNQVALQTAAPRFANCLAAHGLDQVLGVTATTITPYVRLEVAEPVLFRQMSNMVYNLNDSRVYNVAAVEKYKDDRSNDTSVEQMGSFSVEYKVSQAMTWADTVSMTQRIGASMSVSIPFVGVSFGVELSQERQQTVEWGKEVTEERTVSYVQDVTIPPRKKVVLVIVATRAQCDVPFTCRVHDIVADGEIRDYTKTDGLFSGANEFNFITRLTEEDL